MAILELNLLGTFDGFFGRQRLAPSKMGFKTCALLAYLAVEAAMKGDRRHPRTSLAMLFWPHSDSDQKARNNLSQTLYKLRREIGDHDRSDVDRVICTDRHAIWLNPSTIIHLDVTEFLQQVRSRNRASLKRAVELYRDDFLADIALPDCEEFEGWVLLLRETVRLNALNAMEIVADCAIKQGDLAEAEVYARSQLALERTREIAYRQLMLTLALQGRRDAALAQYERCVDVLQEELDVQPDQETFALAEQIRSGPLTACSVPSGDGVDLAVQQTTPSHPQMLDEWAGVMNVEPAGLALIQGYDLWFTSNATGRWRIWRLQSSTSSLTPLSLAPFVTDLGEGGDGYDQFVPAISPDGAKVVFSAGICFPSGRCARDIYLADVGSGEVQRLTHSALDEYHPTWSPDGKQIVYHAGIARTAGDPGIDYGLWVLDLSSGQSRQLTNKMDYDPVWSPSGEYIAYHAMLSEEPTWAIKILQYDSGVAAVNGIDPWIAFNDNAVSTSPTWINNHGIVFASQVNGKWDLFELPVKTDKSYINPHLLTHNEWHNVYPSVFDGRLLIWQAFRHERDADEGSPTERDAEIWVMDLADRSEAPLITGVGNLRDGFLVRQADPSHLSV